MPTANRSLSRPKLTKAGSRDDYYKDLRAEDREIQRRKRAQEKRCRRAAKAFFRERIQCASPSMREVLALTRRLHPDVQDIQDDALYFRQTLVLAVLRHNYSNYDDLISEIHDKGLIGTELKTYVDEFKLLLNSHFIEQLYRGQRLGCSYPGNNQRLSPGYQVFE